MAQEVRELRSQLAGGPNTDSASTVDRRRGAAAADEAASAPADDASVDQR